jgi:hypothetical protein
MWLYGATAASTAAVIVALPSIARRNMKILDGVTILFFVTMTIAGILASAEDRDWMDTYASVISSGVLAVIALGSLAFIPFTEQYARESTPRQVWDQPAFKHVNRVLTLMWGLVFAAIAVVAFISVKAPSTGDWTEGVIPAVLLVAAFKFTDDYYPETFGYKHNRPSRRAKVQWRHTAPVPECATAIHSAILHRDERPVSGTFTDPSNPGRTCNGKSGA